MADYRAGRCTGKAPICDQRNAAAKFFVRTDSLTGIKHLRHTAALRSLIADEYCIAFLHFVVQHSIQAVFFAVKGTCTQYSFEHFLRAGSMLNNSSLRRKVSTQHGDASIGADGVRSRTDDVCAGKL